MKGFSVPQQEVVDARLFESGFSVILNWATGSGKTFMAEQAIGAVLTKRQRAVYLTPLRALATELLGRWTERFEGKKVGVFTGDYGVPGSPYPCPHAEADLLVMTPEHLDLVTRNWRHHLNWLSEVDLVVVDEFHLLGDSRRGARLEGTLLRVQRINPFLRLLCLSATIGNLWELADWLNAVCHQSSWRPVPIDWRLATFKKAADKPDVLLGELPADGGKSIVFVQSRKRAEDLALHLVEHGHRAAFHHAGLTMAARGMVEDDFRRQDGGIDVLVATPTLEMGVNLPARRVVLYDIQRFDGKEGFVPLPHNSVWQRVGRAGRPGLDDKGEAVIIAPKWDTKEAKRYPEGHFEPIHSALLSKAHLAEQIIAEVASGLCRSVTHLERAFAQSLAFLQDRLPTVAKVTAEMIVAGMLCQFEDDAGRSLLKATRLGRIAARHLLTPQTVLLFQRIKDASEQSTFFDLLLGICCAEDCEPVLPVNFEDLDGMCSYLECERSYLLQRTQDEIETVLGVGGKRLLSAIRMAQVLRHWTRSGSESETREAMDLHTSEMLRLKEAAERLLCALAAVSRSGSDDQQDGEQFNDLEGVSLFEKLSVLQRMASCGLNEENATLALVDGIGPKLARRLMDARITDIEELAGSDPQELSAQVSGVSVTRAEKWVDAAESLVKVRSAFCYKEDAAPFVGTDPVGWPSDVDPYRLRRAMDLDVSRTTDGWKVTGGTDPHRVACGEDGSLFCDCVDFTAGHRCKHLLAVSLSKEDGEITDLAARLSKVRSTTIDLYSLWMSNSKGGFW